MGYTVMCVALMLAVMGHVLFGDFSVTMTTLTDSISGEYPSDTFVVITYSAQAMLFMLLMPCCKLGGTMAQYSPVAACFQGALRYCRDRDAHGGPLSHGRACPVTALSELFINAPRISLPLEELPFKTGPLVSRLDQQSCHALPAGYFGVMFSLQVTNYDQDLGVTQTSPMQMNWLLRCEAYAWYFLPPITSILILWWYALLLLTASFWCCPLYVGHPLWCTCPV